MPTKSAKKQKTPSLGKEVNDTTRRVVKQVVVFALAYIAYCVLYSVRKPFSIVKSILETDLHFDLKRLGFIDTCFLLAYAAGQLVLPAFCQKYASVPTVLCLAFMGSCVCAVVFGASSSLLVMSSVWVLNGLFHSVVYPLLVRSLGVWFSSDVRGQVLGTWTTSQQVGSSFATWFATFASSRWGWRYAFYVPAGTNLAMGVILFLCMPRPPAMTITPPLADAEKGEKPKATSHEDETTPEDRLSAPDDGVHRLSLLGAPRASQQLLRSRHASKCDEFSRRPNEASPLVKYGDDAVTHSGAVEECTTTRSALQITMKFASADRTSAISDRSSPAEGHRKIDAAPVLDVSLMRVLNIPDIKSVAAAFFFIKYVRYTILNWLPMYLSDQCGLPRELAGYLSICFDIGGAFGAVFTGWVSDRVFNGRRLLTACIMTGAAAVSVLIFRFVSTVQSTLLIAICLCLLGSTVAGPDSILGAAAAQDLCDRSPYGFQALSIAAGVVNGMGSSGAVFQGIITPMIAQSFGWLTAFTALSGFLALSLFLLSFSLRREALYNKA